MHIEELNFSDYERVIHATDDVSGLNCFIAIDSIKLGPALGGVRFWNYDNDDDALKDVLRLARGMTYKNSLAELNAGGGKAVVNLTGTKKSKKLLWAFARVIQRLNGDYITAEDVGCMPSDLEYIAKFTPHTTSKNMITSPGPATALGVIRGIEACMNFWRHGLEPRRELKGITVAIQGLGNVGYVLAQMLHAKGTNIIGSDFNDDLCTKLKDEVGAEIVEPHEIYTKKYIVFAPCALGGILNQVSIPQLKCKIICGSSNNQLLEPQNGFDLKEREIIYAPDYLVNAGGVINIHRELGYVSTDFHVAGLLDGIYDRCTECLVEAKEKDQPPHVIADKMAEQRL